MPESSTRSTASRVTWSISTRRLFFFLHQVFERLGDLHLPLLGPLAEESGKHVLQVDVHLLGALVGNDLEAGLIAVAHIELDHALVQLALAELLAQLLARALLALAGFSSPSLRRCCRS